MTRRSGSNAVTRHVAPPWLTRETPRQLLASGIALVPFVIAVVLNPDLLNVRSGLGYVGNFLTLLGVFLVFEAVVYAVLTVIAFTRTKGAALAAVGAASSSMTKAERIRNRFLGTDEATLAISAAALSLFSVVVLLLFPGVREAPWVVPGVLASVIGAWILIVVSFAVRYLREWGAHDSVKLDGPADEVEFSDFVHLSVQMSTSYGSGHARFLHPRVRRIATFQNILAFAFNTVILALLVTVALPAVTAG